MLRRTRKASQRLSLQSIKARFARGVIGDARASPDEWQELAADWRPRAKASGAAMA
jgi:hypothetical protein